MARKQKNAKKHSITLRVLVLFVSLYMVFSLTSLYTTYNDSIKERNALKKNLQLKKETVAELKDLLKNGSQEEIIEQAARDRLGYVYSNEEIYTDISGD